MGEVDNVLLKGSDTNGYPINYGSASNTAQRVYIVFERENDAWGAKSYFAPHRIRSTKGSDSVIQSWASIYSSSNDVFEFSDSDDEKVISIPDAVNSSHRSLSIYEKDFNADETTGFSSRDADISSKYNHSMLLFKVKKDTNAFEYIINDNTNAIQNYWDSFTPASNSSSEDNTSWRCNYTAQLSDFQANTAKMIYIRYRNSYISTITKSAHNTDYDAYSIATESKALWTSGLVGSSGSSVDHGFSFHFTMLKTIYSIFLLFMLRLGICIRFI